MNERQARRHDMIDSFLILAIVSLLVGWYVHNLVVENPPIMRIGGNVTIEDGSSIEVMR